MKKENILILIICFLFLLGMARTAIEAFNSRCNEVMNIIGRRYKQ